MYSSFVTVEEIGRDWGVDSGVKGISVLWRREEIEDPNTCDPF